ncbi:MAG: glycosyl hydrolase 115 family protein, partial [Clostridia bacterium]|nr:glycosyl hydrolase 115 family protein [Clostridia bacterium]
LRNNLGELDSCQDTWEAAHPDKTLYKAIQNETKKWVAYYWTDHDADGNAVDNKEFLTDYWRDSVKASGQYDNIYTLGMRGVHDGSFQTNMDYETALKEIIAAQIQILRDELVGEGKKYSRIEDVPMVYIPYKDVLTYYNKPDRLNLPEYVTIMWTDDNYGYMRQNSNETERMSSGKGGVYYHVSYYGWPTSYLWISSTQPALIREQLTRSYEMGSDKVWILNVGDLKPAEKEIEYYARLSRDITGANETEISDVYTEMAKRDFNMTDQDAAEYADIMDTYYELANSKRPEFYRTNDADNKLNISVTAYGDEGERYINRYKDITERAEKLYNALPDDKKPSFYELALYPIRSAKNMAVDFVQSAHATLYNEQGRGGAINAYADEANAAAAQIDTDTTTYNTMLSGKWNNMMVINPKHFSSCDARLTTELNPPAKTELDYTDMGISTEELSISKYDTYAKSFDIYNTGYGSFDYEIATDSQAIKLSKSSGTVYSNERIYVTLDASKAAAGTSAGTITVSQKLGENTVKTLAINVGMSNPADVTDAKTYVEADGTVSVEAEHYTSLTDNGVYKWQVEKDFGRSGDSLKIYPNLSEDVTNTATEMLANSAVASYDIYFETTGTYNVNIYRMPTLNERGTCRVGIGLDNGNPVALGGNNTYPSSSNDTRTKTKAWPNNVLKNNEILTTTVTVSEAGKHTLKLYNVSSGMVIDKIVLVKGSVPYSYFGAPESYNTTYNNEITVPETTDTQKDESKITKTFEPKAVMGDVTNNSGALTVPVYQLDESLNSATIVVSVYDNEGKMTACDFDAITFSNGTAQAQLTIDASAANYRITVIDSFTNMQVIAPYKNYGEIVTEAESTNMRISSDLTSYTGKKSAIIISDQQITDEITAEDIKYFYGGDITDKLYKNIPFNGEGLYNIRVGIDGEQPINETRTTVINIHPDNDGVPIYEYKEDFEGSYDTSAWTKPTASSTVSIETGDSKYLKFTTTSGTTGAYTNLANAIDASGRKVYIGADILFTAPTGNSLGNSQLAIGNAYSSSNFSSNNIDWGVVSTNAGHIIMFEYIGAGKTLTVNGQSVSNEFIGKWTHMEALVNFKTHTMDITLTADGVTTATLTDIPFYSTSYTDTIGGLYVRAAKSNGTTSVDNFGVYTLSAPQYAISVTAVDSSDNEINGATVTVKNSAGTAITPAENGKYMLTEGVYEITVTAGGYTERTETLNLTPALESKDVKITLTPSA